MLAGYDGQIAAADAGVCNLDQDFVFAWLGNRFIYYGNCVLALIADGFHSDFLTSMEVSGTGEKF
jgi:hypothetical protein